MGSNIKPNKQPCCICKEHKPRIPFKIRDDNGTLFTVSHIANCPYCGRFLSENYGEGAERQAEEAASYKMHAIQSGAALEEELQPVWDGGTPAKPYRSTPEGKAAFVAEVLSQLLVKANTGWSGAEYETTGGGEYVYLLNKFGTRSRKVDVTADSLQTIITDTFKEI